MPTEVKARMYYGVEVHARGGYEGGCMWHACRCQPVGGRVDDNEGWGGRAVHGLEKLEVYV